jgi:hypothetical protein
VKQLGFRHSFSIAGLSLLASFFACREPTQITVDITTNTICPTEPLTGPRLVDVMFASGVKINPKSFVEVTTTDQCTPSDPGDQTDTKGFATIGNLVLLPSAEDPSVDVLVVAGVELAGPSAEISPLRLSSAECRDLIQADGVGAIGGKPCILSRRRLGFVDHTKLLLPVDLDSRCIGKKCGEDESCSKGNCIPIDVDCDASGCVEPKGCDDDCDAGCASGTGRCTDGACECLACDAEVCGDACELSQAVGVCADDVCLCRTCDVPACTAECEGECSPATALCDCSVCDADACSANGDGCACNGPMGACACVGPCEPIGCGMTDCAALGFVGSCGTLNDLPACVCACDDTECNDDCELGGSCQPGGACGCNPPCNEAQCASLTCAPGEVGQCFGAGCLCLCENGPCNTFCEGEGFESGSCDASGPDGNCVCNTTSSGGAPPNGGGGDGGNATTTSAGGFGGMGGGGASTSTSTGGFGGMGGAGGDPTTTSSGGFGGGPIATAGNMASLCEGVSVNIGVMCTGMCDPYCSSQGCSGGTCSAGVCSCF